MAVRFGAFEVDLASGELRKQGLRIRLQEQPFAVLALARTTWRGSHPRGADPNSVAGRDSRRLHRGLNAAVTRLRQALSDSAETPRYVETVAR